MTKVVIIGEMTLGETAAPPGFPGQLPVFGPGGRPDQGLPGSGFRPDQGLPGSPGAPDQGLPPIPGQGLPPPGLPPGEIWPPLPPGATTPKVAYALIAIPGVGYRYTVVELKPGHPDQGLPGGRPGRPAYPDQGLPGSGLRPDQGFDPNHPDQGLPGRDRPPRPDQGLPDVDGPTPEPHHRR